MSGTPQSNRPIRKQPLRVMLLALLVSTTGAHATTDTNDTTADTNNATLRLLTAQVNDKPFEAATRMLQTAPGRLLVPTAALKRWGLTLPDDVTPIERDGRAYYPLDAFDNLNWSIDESTQTLEIQAGTDRFAGSHVDLGADDYAAPRNTTTGGFINYDLLFEGREAGTNNTSGTFEFGGFNSWGIATTTLLARNRYRNNGVVRLNTTLRHDEPDTMRTLTLGDTFSRSGSWGRSVQYAGIQWGTNFGTRPDFTTFPRPAVSGETTVPSTVEVFANDRRRGSGRVGAGPFSIRDIPVTTGANHVRVVTTDVLGRERVITRSFYASRDLLQSGLHDYTYEAGAIRENYSRRSNDYGRGFAAATHRLGLSSTLTSGFRLEALADQQTAGISSAWLPDPRLGVITAAVAGSHSSHVGNGSLMQFGFQRQSQYFNFGARTTYTTADFRQLGLRRDESAPRQIVHANIGGHVPHVGSIGLSYTDIDRRDRASSQLLNATYSTRLFGDVALSLFASQNLDDHTSSVALTLNLPLGPRTSASTSYNRASDGGSNRVEVQRNLPHGAGVGYRVAAEDGHGRPDRGRAQVTARTQYGEYRAEATRARGNTAYRLNASGGVALIGGHAFLSRQIDDSFGVVEVGDYPDVTIYNDNQPVAETNADGAALIPDLRSFEDNRLSFEQADLPLDAHLDERDATVVPGYRRGVLVKFDVASPNGALLTVHRPDGEPLPAGATVHRVGDEQQFPVARRGEVWVTGLEQNNQLIARWGNHRCRFEAAMPDNPGAVPHVGPLTCREIAR